MSEHGFHGGQLMVHQCVCSVKDLERSLRAELEKTEKQSRKSKDNRMSYGR